MSETTIHAALPQPQPQNNDSTSDRLLDLFASALERQSKSFDAFSSKVEDGFESLRADLKWGFLLFAGVLVFSQLLMFALVGGSVWFQYTDSGGVALRLNDAAKLQP